MSRIINLNVSDQEVGSVLNRFAYELKDGIYKTAFGVNKYGYFIENVAKDGSSVTISEETFMTYPDPVSAPYTVKKNGGVFKNPFRRMPEHKILQYFVYKFNDTIKRLPEGYFGPKEVVEKTCMALASAEKIARHNYAEATKEKLMREKAEGVAPATDIGIDDDVRFAADIFIQTLSYIATKNGKNYAESLKTAVNYICRKPSFDTAEDVQT